MMAGCCDKPVRGRSLRFRDFQHQTITCAVRDHSAERDHHEGDDDDMDVFCRTRVTDCLRLSIAEVWHWFVVEECEAETHERDKTMSNDTVVPSLIAH